MHLGKNTNDLLLSLLLLIGHSEWASRHRWPIRQMYNSRAFTFGISSYSILPSQKLVYILYHTILQYTQHFFFFFFTILIKYFSILFKY